MLILELPGSLLLTGLRLSPMGMCHNNIIANVLKRKKGAKKAFVPFSDPAGIFCDPAGTLFYVIWRCKRTILSI